MDLNVAFAVTGGSNGGYMVLSSKSHFNDRLRCGDRYHGHQ